MSWFARVIVLFNTEFAAGGDGETVVLACGAEPQLPGSLDAWRVGGRQVEPAGECAGVDRCNDERLLGGAAARL